MPFARRTHCARCGYELTGLPQRYRCPECGERYDARDGGAAPAAPLFGFAILALLPLLLLAGGALAHAADIALDLAPALLATAAMAALGATANSVRLARSLTRAARARGGFHAGFERARTVAAFVLLLIGHMVALWLGLVLCSLTIPLWGAR